MKKKYLTFILFTILFINPVQTLAQNWLIYTTQNSGLPSNNITSIKPTSQNKIWIGTDEGVAVFDWNNWQVFDSLNSVLPTNFILDVEEDINGDIWIGTGREEWAIDTIGGLSHYNGNDWQLYTVNNSDLAGPYNNILAAAPDSSIWIFTWPGTLSGYGITQNFDGVNWFTLPWQISEFYPKEFKVDENNILWIGAFHKGLGRYDGNQLIFYGKENWGQTCSYVKDLAIDPNGNKWLAVSCWPQKGIVKYDGNIFTLYEIPISPQPSDILSSLDVDDMGNVWVGTNSNGLVKFDGQNWEIFDTSNSPLPDNLVWFVTVDQFNNVWMRSGNTLTVFNENRIATPVELVSFYADISGNWVILSWMTSTETNNQGFYIERKKQEQWEIIGYVIGQGTTTEPQTYSFKDLVDFSGIIQYRLKQVDLDGTYSYSNIIEVEISLPQNFYLFQNHPNPFNPSTKIKFTVPFVETGHAPSLQLIVYDVLGKEVATLVNEEKPAGSYEVEFNAANLPSGVYFYQFRAGSFIQTKKMILLR